MSDRVATCSVLHLLSRWFLARLILRPWRWRRYVSPKRRLTFNGLHGVISQKIVLLTGYSCSQTDVPMLIHFVLVLQAEVPMWTNCVLVVQADGCSSVHTVCSCSTGGSSNITTVCSFSAGRCTNVNILDTCTGGCHNVNRVCFCSTGGCSNVNTVFLLFRRVF
jgi:hypothetical protein